MKVGEGKRLLKIIQERVNLSMNYDTRYSYTKNLFCWFMIYFRTIETDFQVVKVVLCRKRNQDTRKTTFFTWIGGSFY